MSTREPIFCDYCQKDPGPDPRNKHLWNGFIDRCTGKHVCWGCKDVHYQNQNIKPYPVIEETLIAPEDDGAETKYNLNKK